ncbi:autotransporter domain-containing protein [Synechococcus sp. FACHB-909]|uniref:autotransporter family protein n=1 Tax=Synechococcus sp. FACHB-909 TaxID=2692863 RepID=UPI001689B454|nr:autotransporter domain-containing protein [Synechococcus sp. FACHB-909]MBD2717798.1 autotransporter domain-containing protein [Synechococcus sp. FACHB-909]
MTERNPVGLYLIGLVAATGLIHQPASAQSITRSAVFSPVLQVDGGSASTSLDFFGFGGNVGGISTTINLTKCDDPISASGVCQGIGFSFNDEIQLQLLSPAGIVRTLVPGGALGGQTPGGTATWTFADSAASTVSGSTLETGSFRPSESFSAFLGQNGSGLWTLIFTDLAGGDPLSINSWFLTLLPEGIVPGSPAIASSPYSTTFAGGTLIVDGPGSFATSYVVGSAGGSIDLNGNNSTFSGVFSGPGALAFINSGLAGSTNLTGISTFTGATVVGSNSTVFVNGSLASSSGLTVQSGGKVGGTGFLPTTTIESGGKIAPGNSIGAITVANLNLNGGTFEAEIQGPLNDRINVMNNVTNLAGNVQLVASGGGVPWPIFSYVLVDASNSIDFTNLNALTLNQSGVNSALLSAGTTLVQGADGNPRTIDVQWRPRNGIGPTGSAMQFLGRNGVNQLATAGAVDRVFQRLALATTNNANSLGIPIGLTGFTSGQAVASGISPDFLLATSQLLSLPSFGQLTAAIDSLSPEPYAAFQSVGIETLKRQRELLMNQAGQCSTTGWVVNPEKGQTANRRHQPLCVFVQAANATSSVQGSGGLSGYDSGIFSSFYGIEFKPSEQWTIGAAYGYGTSALNNMSLTNAMVSSNVNSASIYGLYKPSRHWSVRGLIGYANYNTTGSRNVAFIGNGTPVQGSLAGDGYTVALNADYLVNLSKPSSRSQVFLKPFVGVAWASYGQSGLTESGGEPLNLSIEGNRADSLVGTIGFELASSPIALNKARTAALTPKLALAYQVDALANDAGNRSLSSSLPSAPAAGSFVTQGENRGTNTLLIDGAVDIQVSSHTNLYVSVGYEVFSTGSQFTYGGGVKVKF